MIDLTPLDVRKKKEDFRRAVRGYDVAQVDSFLSIVADRLEELVGDHRALAQEVDSLRQQLAVYREREKALNEALLAAQELREEARSQADRDAAVRLREAETHAEAILLDADQAIRHAQRRMEDLQARRTHFIRSVRSMLDRFSDYVQLEEARLEGEPDDLGDLLGRLEGEPETPETDIDRTAPSPEPEVVEGSAADAESEPPASRNGQPGASTVEETSPAAGDGSPPSRIVAEADAPEAADAAIPPDTTS
jgi:cell division initiation protein